MRNYLKYLRCVSKMDFGWDDWMKVLLEDIDMDDMNILRERMKKRACTLYSFMMTGVEHGKCSHDLGSIFHLIEQYPLGLYGDAMKPTKSRMISLGGKGKEAFLINFNL